MEDLEVSQLWLQRLGRLNEVIAATRQPLVGGLLYDHLQENYVHSAPNPILRAKRDRFRQAIIGSRRLLEVGVNGGHSAFLALTSNAELEYYGVDICEHDYVRPVVKWLQAEFPGRVFFYAGDSRRVLPRIKQTGLKFDAFHIDGAKHTYYQDICNCQQLARDARAAVILDDTQQEQVTRVWEKCLAQRRIHARLDFPAMPEAQKYRNQIGTLSPESSWRATRSRILLVAGNWAERAVLLARRLRVWSGRRLTV
jgi:predicted O-methyltransferase YrrM